MSRAGFFTRTLTGRAIIMAVTRRELAGMIAASAAVGAPQAVDEETRSAQEALEQNAQQLDKISLPMAIEPACHFKP